jgi:hypothetical protein
MAKSKDTSLSSVLFQKYFPGSFGAGPGASIANLLNNNQLKSVLVAEDYPGTTIP